MGLLSRLFSDHETRAHRFLEEPWLEQPFFFFFFIQEEISLWSSLLLEWWSLENRTSSSRISEELTDGAWHVAFSWVIRIIGTYAGKTQLERWHWEGQAHRAWNALSCLCESQSWTKWDIDFPSAAILACSVEATLSLERYTVFHKLPQGPWNGVISKDIQSQKHCYVFKPCAAFIFLLEVLCFT